MEVLGLGSLPDNYDTYNNSYVLSTEECWVGVPLTVGFELLKVGSCRIYFWGNEVMRSIVGAPFHTQHSRL